MTSSAAPEHAPVVVGGMASYGVELVIGLLGQMGIHIANRSDGFGDFYDRWSLPRRLGGIVGRGTADPDWIRQAWMELEATVSESLREQPGHLGRWGWGDPRTGLSLSFLKQCFPGTQYVHVVQDGRNQALLVEDDEPAGLWDALYGESAEPELTPRQRARLWNRFNMSILGEGPDALDRDLLIVRLEDLAEHPLDVLTRLRDVLFAPGRGPDDDQLTAIADSVGEIPALDYWKDQDPDLVDDLESSAADGLFRFGYQPPRPFDALPPGPPLLILSPPRGGGSALAGCLEVCGYSFGIALMNDDANHDNGSWANERISAFNERLLEDLGSRWNDPGAVDPMALFDDSLVQRFRDMVSQEFAESENWAVKDPRLNRLLPLWSALIKAIWSDPPKVAIMMRPPEDSALSLVKRERVSEEEALALWMSYAIDAEVASRELQRHFMDFDALLDSPRRELDQMFEALQLTPRPESVMNSAIEWVDKGLKHTTAQARKSKSEQPTIGDFWKSLQRLRQSDTTMNHWHVDGFVKAWRGTSIPDHATASYKAKIGAAARREQRDLLARLAESRWRYVSQGTLPEIPDYTNLEPPRLPSPERVPEGIPETHLDEQPAPPPEAGPLDGSLPAETKPAFPDSPPPEAEVSKPDSKVVPSDPALEPEIPLQDSMPRQVDADQWDADGESETEDVPAPLPEPPLLEVSPFPGYAEWVALFDQLTDGRRAEIRRWAQQQAMQMKLAVIVWRSDDTSPSAVSQTLESLEIQLLPIERILLRAARAPLPDDWLEAPIHESRKVLSPGPDLASWLNGAIKEAEADWIMLVEAGTRLHETASLQICATIKATPDAVMIHGDFDHLGAGGLRTAPLFKGRKWDPDFHLGRDALRGGFAFRAKGLPEKEPFQPGYDRATVYEASLRLTENWPLETILHVPHILSHVPMRVRDLTDRRPAVGTALARRRRKAKIIDTERPDILRFSHTPPLPHPRVTILMVINDRVDSVNRIQEEWTRSTSYSATDWVLVDNTSTIRPEPVASNRGDTRVIRMESPAPFWVAVTRGLEEAKGEYVCLAEPDLVPENADWLDEMVGLAAADDIGAVGAKFLRTDGLVDQAGMVLGLNRELVGPLHRGMTDEELVERGEGQQLRQAVVVNSGCLVMRRAVLDETGGFDTDHFPVAHADLDLFLRLRARGLKVMWTPLARLVRAGWHPEPELTSDRLQLIAKWNLDDYQDPYFSRNYSLESSKPVLSFPPRARRPWQDLVTMNGAALERAIGIEYALAGEERGPWLYFGRHLLERGDARRALDLARSNMQLDPDSLEARILFFEAAAALGGTDRALQVYETIDPTQVKRLDLDVRLARAVLAGGNIRMARPFAERALERSSNNVRARIVLADCLEAIGDLGAAAMVLENGTQMFPENHALHAALGHIKLERDDPTAALTSLRKATELGADSRQLYMDLARALLKTGQASLGADISLTGIYRFGLNSGLALINAQCLLADKRERAAAQMLSAGYRLDPDNDAISDLLFPLLKKRGQAKEAKRLREVYGRSSE